jgi:hypothetical protein
MSPLMAVTLLVQISQLEEPVILSNTIVEQWRARRLWNPEYFIQQTPHFNGVQKHHDKTFSYFHEDRPMSRKYPFHSTTVYQFLSA